MIRLVICDDEQATETIIRYFIKINALPIDIVGVAHDGAEAVRLIEEVKPTVVFMDIMMPHKNGFEVIEAVGETVPPEKIIIITGFESFEFAQRALRLGVCDIILKPLSFDQLNKAINNAVGWKITSNALVNSALEYIYSNYAENITLESLAEQLFCSGAHLAREFKKNLNCGMTTYLRNVRIQKAIQLLSKGELSLAEIAEQTGYQSLNGFYLAFRAYTGSTPAAYAKSLTSDKAGEES